MVEDDGTGAGGPGGDGEPPVVRQQCRIGGGLVEEGPVGAVPVAVAQQVRHDGGVRTPPVVGVGVAEDGHPGVAQPLRDGGEPLVGASPGPLAGLRTTECSRPAERISSSQSSGRSAGCS